VRRRSIGRTLWLPGPDDESPEAVRRTSVKRRLGRALLAVLIAVPALTVALILPWRWLPPPITAFILRERLVSDEPVYYDWVPYEQISANLAISVVAAEDQKFPIHHGFDWESIQEALEAARNGDDLRGASTISQQVAKNLYLTPGQNWVRKGTEAYLTAWIELLWPKRRILEVYMNVAEFGPGVFGVGAASERLVGKPPAELSGYDASVLAAVLPSPKRMFVDNPSTYVRTRAGQIRTSVRQLGGGGYLAGL
jgi:monofunctional biosynthetic peptidoglycan transglycosylase